MFLDSKVPISPNSLKLVVDAMSSLGLILLEAKIRNDSYDWNTQNISLILANASREEEITLIYANPELKFEISQEIRWNPEQLGRIDRVWIKTYTFDTAYFWNSAEESETYSELLLRIGIELYNIFSPTFGWIDFNFGIFTTHEDVESINLPALYWANFLGPRFVEKIGRQKIESAPNWKLERLADGGYLYVLSSGLGLSRESVSSERVKTIFGAVKVR